LEKEGVFLKMTNTNPIITITYKDINGQKFADTKTITNISTGTSTTTKFDTSKQEKQISQAQQSHITSVAKARGVSESQVLKEIEQQKQAQEIEKAKEQEVKRIQEMQKQAQTQTIEKAQQTKTFQTIQQAQQQQTQKINQAQKVPVGSTAFYDEFKKRQAEKTKEQIEIMKPSTLVDKKVDVAVVETDKGTEKRTTTTTTITTQPNNKFNLNKDFIESWGKRTKEVGADIKRYKEEGVKPTDINLKDIKADIPSVSQRSKEILSKVATGEIKVNTGNIDMIEKARFDAMTSKEGITQLRQPIKETITPQTQLQKDYFGSTEKVQDYFSKTGVKVVATPLIIAGGVTIASPLLAKVTTTTTGKIIAGALAGRFVYSFGKESFAVTTGKGFEDKPIARFVTGTQLVSKAYGVGLGVASVKAKSINPKSYELTSKPQTYYDAQGTKIISYGKVETFSGKKLDVVTQITTDKQGTGTYITSVLGKTSASKPVYLDKGTIDLTSIKIGTTQQTYILKAVSSTGKETIGLQKSFVTPQGEFYFSSSDVRLISKSPKGLITTTRTIDETSTMLGKTIKSEYPYSFFKVVGQKTNIMQDRTKVNVNLNELVPTKLLASKKAEISSLGFSSTQPTPIFKPLIQTEPSLLGIGSKTTIMNIPQITPIILPIGLTGATQDNKVLTASLPSSLTPTGTTSRTITRVNVTYEPITQPIEQTQPQTISSTGTGTGTTTKTTTTTTPPPPPTTPPPIQQIQTIITTTPKLPKFKFEKDTKSKKMFTGFDVFVKKQGKLINVTKGFTLTKEQALDFGAYKVDTTPSASFFIKAGFEPIKELTQNIKGTYQRKRSNLYKKGRFMIEKPSKRITSLGEKKGITFKGIQTKKLRKVF